MINQDGIRAVSVVLAIIGSFLSFSAAKECNTNKDTKFTIIFIFLGMLIWHPVYLMFTK